MVKDANEEEERTAEAGPGTPSLGMLFSY